MSALGARVAGGLVLAGGIAVAAWRARSLSMDGAACAVVVGTLCVAAGWDWGALLIAFFLSGSGLSRLKRDVKAQRTGAIVAKGGDRDAVQVLANGGLFAAAAVAFLVHPAPLWQALGAGALGASTADTWGTEIGTLARGTPISILTWRRVPAGTSGGITVLGTAAAVAGAVFLGLVASVLGWAALVVLGGIVGGIVGETADSLLGAAVQARRRCPQCGTATERHVHTCGTRTEGAGGIPWLTNDGVNAFSAVIGAVASAGCYVMAHGR